MPVKKSNCVLIEIIGGNNDEPKKNNEYESFTRIEFFETERTPGQAQVRYFRVVYAVGKIKRCDDKCAFNNTREDKGNDGICNICSKREYCGRCVRIFLATEEGNNNEPWDQG